MQVIYADVLISLNIYVNFILLQATAKITHSRLKTLRCIIAGIYGSLYSLLILIPSISTIANIFIKMFAAVTIVIIAFGFYDKIRTLVNILCFFITNFIFAGVIFAVYILLKPSFMYFNNTYFYIDFSLLLMIFMTALLYTVLSILRFFLDKYSATNSTYRIIIRYNNEIISLKGLADTGNSLVDFFSGKPVIICSYDELSRVISLPDINKDEDILNFKGFRLIPYSTVGNSGMIPVFKPDEVLIVNDENKFRKKVDVLIAVKSNENRAIFNPQLLKL